MTRTRGFLIGRTRTASLHRTRQLLAAACVAVAVAQAATAVAQTAGAPLPTLPRPAVTELRRFVYDAAELDRIVSPIALYPDPLLAQLLNAATFPREIPFAAQWVDRRRGLSGEQLVDALAFDRVPWDPSVQSLVAFPSVLQMMASAMPWTEELGDAFLTQHQDVMDAVQRMRQQAQRYGYLRSNDQWRVTSSPVIEIVPVNPAYVVVPYYDPYVVYYPPRPRFVVSSAIYFGFGVRLGLWYEPWGWRQNGFDWGTRRVVYGYPGWNRPRDYRYTDVRSYRFDPRRDPRDDNRRIGDNDNRRGGNDDRRAGNDNRRGNDQPTFRTAVPRGSEPRRGDDNGRAVNGGDVTNSGYRNGNAGNGNAGNGNVGGGNVGSGQGVGNGQRVGAGGPPGGNPTGGSSGGGNPSNVQRQQPRDVQRAAPPDMPRDARRGGGRDVEPVQVQVQPRTPRTPDVRPSEPRQVEQRRNEPRQSEPRQGEQRQPEGRTAQPRGGRELPPGRPDASTPPH